jgi:hypothetical protein
MLKNAGSGSAPDPAFQMNLSKSRIQGFDDQKLENYTCINLYLFLVKNCNFLMLFLGLHKGRPIYRRSLQPPKENIQHFKR